MSIAAISGYNAYQPTTSVAPTSYNPYSSSPVSSDTGSTGSGFSTDFNSISSMAAHAAGGGFSGYKLGGKMAESMKSVFAGGGIKGVFTGVKNVAFTGIKGAGLSALVGAGVSAVANGVGAATGKVDKSQAVTNVVKDTIGAAVGGFTGVTAAGVGSMIFKGGGTLGLVVSVGLGAVGGVLGGQLAKKMTDNF